MRAYNPDYEHFFFPAAWGPDANRWFIVAGLDGSALLADIPKPRSINSHGKCRPFLCILGIRHSARFPIRPARPILAGA